jgi:hypothetical protein
MIVDRGILDSDLVAAAQQAKVRVLQPAMVREQKRVGDVWHLDVHGTDSNYLLQADFVVEATGRRMRFRRRRRQGASTLALCGNWLGPVAATVRISAHSDHWCWSAPTGRQETSLICFIDPQHFQTLRGSVRERYIELARQSGVLTGGSLALGGEPHACNATPYLTEHEVNATLLGGDADMTLDPLSSSGVQAAIQSAVAIGPIVNTLLTPGKDADAAIEFWRTSRTRRMAQHRDWSRRLYAHAHREHCTKFWADRPESGPVAETTGRGSLPAPDQLIRLSEHTRFIHAPCLTEKLVKRLECVSHSDLAEPSAFFGAVHLATQLRQANASPPIPARRLLETWSASMPPNAAFALLAWAWHNGLLEAA